MTSLIHGASSLEVPGQHGIGYRNNAIQISEFSWEQDMYLECGLFLGPPYQNDFLNIYICADLIFKNKIIYTWVYFLALCSVPLVYVPVFMPVPGCFNDSGLIMELISGIFILPALFFFLKIAAAIRGSLRFHINFWKVYSISVKYVMGTLIGISLNL